MTFARHANFARGPKARATIGSLHARYASGESTPSEELEITLRRIAAAQTLNAFASTRPELARRLAEASDERWRRGQPLSSVDGVPFTVKEVFDVPGYATRRGSLNTSSAPATSASPVVRTLLDAGAVAVGTTTTAEFGWTGTTSTALHGVTRNPWDLSATPGGSSGGSAAAVAAGLGVFSVGTDGGGSVRIPASLCGVVGLKPTRDVLPMPSTPYGDLAHAGFICSTVNDARDLLALFSRDGEAATPAPPPEPCLGVIVDDDIRQEDEVRDLTQAGLRRLEGQGYRLRPWTLPLPREEIRHVFDVLWHSALRRIWDSSDEDARARMTPALRAKIDSTRSFSGTEQAAARVAQRLLTERVAAGFASVDLLVSSTTNTVAPKLETPDTGRASATMSWPDWTPNTYPFNLTGDPAVSIPLQPGPSCMPVGMQLVCPAGRDWTLLRHAAGVEALVGNTDASLPSSA